ncbi:MAG: spore cortex biosynthesis protein YabQ [Oscillospiraceae bacterium]|nr:spore cortex biosynthesis protein YabQ [Oscillospiraceae bacterium]
MLDNFFSLSYECQIFLYSIILGIGLGIVFDIFRVIRAVIPHNNFFVAFEDILFMLIWTFSLVIFSVELSGGNIRFFCFMGTFLGFVIYFFSVGKIVITFIRNISSFIRQILNAVFGRIYGFLRHCFVSVCQKVKYFFVDNYTNLRKSKKM